MFDITADISRAVTTGVIFLYLRSIRGKEPPRLRKAWIFFIIGFGLLFLGGLLNIADNFPALTRYLSFGRHHYADFLEQVVGYVFGFLFLGIGFWHWIPAILALRAEEVALRNSQPDLRREVVELTMERNKLKTIVACGLSYAAQEAHNETAGGSKDR
ncbi:MAG: hypothetical protein L7F78_20080 [Syntrophales bacterium LBB04]|nr:hypothetical protein [Syntrophales bacterium LBB04]